MFVPINVTDVKQNERRFLKFFFIFFVCLVRKILKTSVWDMWDALKTVLGRYEHASCRFYYRRDGSCSGQSRNCMRVF